MNISDETLMAYVDDELDSTARTMVETELAVDPALAVRLARQQALLGMLRETFDGVLEEPVPERLVAAARGADDSGAAVPPPVDFRNRVSANVVAARRWAWPQWGALAASLFVGVLAGRVLPVRETTGLAAEDGQVIARGALARALSEQLASAPPDEAAPLRVGLSFRAKSGDYCRTFTLAAESKQPPIAGLACKQGPDWGVRMLAQAEVAAGADYRMAASALPAAVLRAVDDSIAGSPLDATTERAARDGGWRR